MKRAADVILAATALLLLAPVMGAVVILVLLDSGRPVLYRGLRSGRNGEPFEMLKFRSMVRDAERLGGGSTGKDDPRLTRCGRWLRQYKLDELPQLVNVLKGEMSLVGPRPELPQYTREYQGDELLILSVRPGITDYASLKFVNLAEVLGETDVDLRYEEVIRPVKNQLRVRYVREHTFWVDCKILGMTVLGVVRRRPWNI